MKKATTIKEIFNIFKPEEFLTEEKKDFYVDIFAEDMKEVSDELEWSENEQETIFIAGQPGNGKSTALRLLPYKHKELSEKYDIIYLNARDIFDPYMSIDAIDVVLMVGFLFANKADNLRNKYVAKLEKLKSMKLGEYERIEQHSQAENIQESTSVDSGFKVDLKFLKIGADFEDNIKLDENTKITTRKLLKTKKKDFLEATNETIREYRKSIGGDKKILLVIDDIEKLKDSDVIFTNDIGTLLQLECAKLITMPIHLKRSETYAGHMAIELSIKLKEKNDDKCININIDLLKNIIKSRIDEKVYNSIITDDAVEKIVLMSGGNVLQLMTLVKKSALNAKDFDIISMKNVENSIYRLRKQYSSATQMMEEFLEDIKIHKKPKNYDEENIQRLAKATRDQMIFAYHNDDSWYDLNPIIAKKEPCIIQK